MFWVRYSREKHSARLVSSELSVIMAATTGCTRLLQKYEIRMQGSMMGDGANQPAIAAKNVAAMEAVRKTFFRP